MPITIQNLPKAWVLVLGIVAVTLLVAIGKVDADAGLPVITALSGYGLGNGIGAKNAARNGTGRAPNVFGVEGEA